MSATSNEAMRHNILLLGRGYQLAHGASPSGEWLAKQLGVNRTHVWRRLRELESAGEIRIDQPLNQAIDWWHGSDVVR